MGPEQKITREVDAELVRLLVALREDICRHLHAIEMDVSLAKGEIAELRQTNKGLSGQHQRFTDEIFRLTAELEKAKSSSAENESRTADGDAAVRAELRGELRGEIDKLSEGMGALLEALEVQKDTALGKTKPGEEPNPTLPRIRKQTALTLASTGLAVLLLALQILWRLLSGHG